MPSMTSGMSSTESKVIVNATTEKYVDSNVKKKAIRSRYSTRDSMEDHLESESLLITRQGAQCIPMSPVSTTSIQSPIESGTSSSQKLFRNHSSNTVGNASFSLNDSPELQSIKPANSRTSLSNKLHLAQSTTSISSKLQICSPRFCCGGNPLRITFIVLSIVIIWSIIIFCVNIQKQLYRHKEDLGVLRHEISKLESKNAELTKENDLINVVLSKIATSMMTSRKNNKSPHSTGPSAKPKSKKKQRKEPTKNETCTASGQKCIFPFIYKDVVHRSCVKEWTYPRPWCATNVDGDGKYVSGDSSGWSECLPSCP